MHGGAKAISGALDQKTIYSVYTGYEKDETGAYDLILGRSVQDGQKAPKQMKIVRIPTARYVVFLGVSSSPSAIRTAWMSVYRYLG